MTKETEKVLNYHKTKIECEKKLKELKKEIICLRELTPSNLKNHTLLLITKLWQITRE